MEKHTTSTRRIIICLVTILTLGAPTAHGERLKAKIKFTPRTVVHLVTLRLAVKCTLVPAEKGDEDGVLDVKSVAGVTLKQNNSDGDFETVASVSFSDPDDPKLNGNWDDINIAVDAHLNDNARLLEVNVTDPVKEHTGDMQCQIFVNDGEQVKTLSCQDKIGYKMPDQDIFFSELRRLKFENEAKQQEISAQQQNISDLSKTNEAQQQEISDLNKTNEAQQKDIVLQKEQITDLEKKESTKVSFSAVKDYGDESVSRDTVIVFNKTLVNQGGGYNTRTGVFTCPLAGTYYLRYDLQLLPYDSSPFFGAASAGVNLLLNGAEVTWSYKYDMVARSPMDVIGAGLVLQLKQGDKLKVQTDRDSRFYWKYNDGYGCMFIGYLLK